MPNANLLQQGAGLLNVDGAIALSQAIRPDLSQAIRNGSVYGHIIFTKKERIFSPVVPYGKANLILGVDILETARGGMLLKGMGVSVNDVSVVTNVSADHLGLRLSKSTSI